MNPATDLRGPIRRLSALRRRSVTLDKISYLAALHARHRGDVVLVYSMPKVASSTMRRAIAESTGRPALHFHNMTRAALDADRDWWRQQSADRHLLWQWRGEYARYRVRYGRHPGKWQVVNGIREPIARSLSAFFHMGQRAGYFDADTRADDVDLEAMRAQFVAYFPSYSDWFRNEFQPATGLDVYETPFDWAQGYAEYENDRFHVLTIRQEDLASAGPAALTRHLQEDDIQLPRRNAADRKFYEPLYRRFKNEVRLPARLIDDAYSTEQARHFYSPAELDDFRAAWGG